MAIKYSLPLDRSELYMFTYTNFSMNFFQTNFN
jgi:hypothetical protein